MKQRYLFIIAALFAFAACREDYPDMQNPRWDINIYNWDQAFESYWNGLNYNYLFWDIDPTDWDEVYREYKPRFEALKSFGFDSTEINNQAFDMIREMSGNLIDHHFAIQFFMPDTTYWFYPGNEEVSSREYNRHPDYNLWDDLPIFLLIKEKEGRFTEVAHNFYSGNSDMSVFSGVLDGNIVYLGFSSFLFYGYEGIGDEVELALQNYQDLLDNYPDVQGVIIDVRSNGGGYNRDLNQVLGKLVPQNHTAFYSRQKNGIGRLDYAPWVPEEIKWQERTRELQVPVVVLADVNSVSMAEMTAMAVLSLPNGAVIGERTFGGNGSLAPANEYFDVTYSGFFENDVMWIYTTNTMSRDVNGVIHEGVGIPPTIECLFDPESWNQGIDMQLERAVSYIRNGK